MANKTWPTLYQKAQTGKILEWTIRVEGNYIIKTTGEMGGKLRDTTPSACDPKNVGRSNETTAEAQALLEAQSQWQKKLDNKYSLTMEIADEGTKILPMLANHLDSRKGKEVYPADLQRKYDGVRCMAMWEGDRIKLLSRGNKEYTVPAHINVAVAKVLPKGRIFDGEIYLHGLTLQEINRRVKKHRGADTDALQYHIYDYVNPENLDIQWFDRYANLYKLFFVQKPELPLQLVDTIKVVSRDEVNALEKYYVAEGYEGAIYRPLDAPYVYGKKTNNILKVKSFTDDEYEIVGYAEGKGKNEGAVTWKCKMIDGQTFDVSPKGTYADKKYWFENGETFIGKMLTVKHFGFTEGGIPNLPVGKSIRLEEDMDEKEAA